MTARVSEIRFLYPVRVGNLVFVHANLTFVKGPLMEVLVELEAENLATEKRVRALTAYFIMVALDKNGKPRRVPPLIICTEKAEKLYEEGLLRYQANKARRRK